MVVKVVAEDGTVTSIIKDTTTQLFAGYYVDEVADLTVRKGHIVTRTFKLQLENSKSTKLELVSRLIGDRSKPVYRSINTNTDAHTNKFGIQNETDPTVGTIDTKVERDNYYQEEGNYDLAPIQYQNIDTADFTFQGIGGVTSVSVAPGVGSGYFF